MLRKNAFFVGLTLINNRANLRYVICCSALISCNKVNRKFVVFIASLKYVVLIARLTVLFLISTRTMIFHLESVKMVRNFIFSPTSVKKSKFFGEKMKNENLGCIEKHV